MRILTVLLTGALLAGGGCASMRASSDSAVTTALANAARLAEDRERDVRDHPAEVLGLADFRRGMTVADIFGGGGYYSEIIANIVGPSGQVRLINNTAYDNYSKKGLVTRLADNRLPNVRYEILPPEAMKLGTASLDGALIVMSYHDLYVSDPGDGWPAIDAGQFIDQIVTALKPGGVLLIVDHQARPGTGKDDTQKLHRIEESFAIGDFKAHGLQFVGSIPVLRNAEDDHSKIVFDATIRGKTDRFVHLYRKPGK